MSVVVGVVITVLRHDIRNGEEGRSLEQHNLLGLELFRKCFEKPFNDDQVGNHLVYNPRPRLVQRLVPDTARECLETQPFRSSRDQTASLLVYPLP